MIASRTLNILAALLAAWLLLGTSGGAVRAADENWLANPGFEEGAEKPVSWDLGMEGKGEGEAVWQKGKARSKERCVRVRLTTQGDYYMARQRVAPAKPRPGVLHQLTGWYRSDTEMAAHPCVYNQAADGKLLSAVEAALPRSDEWAPFQLTWVPPDGTTRFEVQLRVQGVIGTVWFDDVLLGTNEKLEAERKALEARAKEVIAKGPLTLRALRPSERPRASDLMEPARFRELERAKEVSLFAARDEREAFGAAVMGLRGATLTAKVSDLIGPRKARIPASQVRVRWAETVATRAGAFPDPLLEQQPFRAPKEGFPILWVTVHVPRQGVPAGDYRGTLTAEAGGQKASLPVRLRVHDFALPKTTFLQSSFWLFRHTIRNAYGLKEVPFDEYRKYLDLCLETRLSPVDAAEWHDQPFVKMVRDERAELQVDWPEWDRYLGYCMERGMSAFNVADDHWFGNFFRSFPVRDLRSGETKQVTLDPESEEYAETVTRFFRLAREHFAARGWADRAYLQAYDEPGRDEKLLAEIRRFHDLARRGWPGLRTLITAPSDGYDGLHGSVGIWCPLTPHYQDEAADERRGLGEEVWWYVCCAPHAPWANFFLDQPGAAHRVLFWQTFQRRAQGLLYWGVNHWPGFAGRTMEPVAAEKRWPNVPWDDGGRNGDGYFLYPGPEGPLTGIRFEIMRDGVEDYDCLRMLEALVKEKAGRAPAPLRERAAKALAIGPEISRTMTTYPKDAGAMVARRREVNALIEAFSKMK